MQVVIALIVTPDGFPLGYEVLPGNTSDKTTLRDMLRKIEAQYGKANRIWVMDRGIPTEEVLAEMRAADPPVFYLVGTPKGRLSKLEKALVALPWQAVRQGVDVKLLAQEQELYVLAQSHARIDKERAMRRRKLKWLWARLKEIAAMEIDREELFMKLGAARSQGAGGLAARHNRRGDPSRATFSFALDRDKLRQVRRREGRYLLRTNLSGTRAGRAVAVLHPTRRGRGGLQEPEGRSATASDLSPARRAHRGAHLRRLPGLLPARHAARTAQAAGARPYAAGCTRQVRRHPDARRAFPDHRRPHLDPAAVTPNSPPIRNFWSGSSNSICRRSPHHASARQQRPFAVPANAL